MKCERFNCGRRGEICFLKPAAVHECSGANSLKLFRKEDRREIVAAVEGVLLNVGCAGFNGVANRDTGTAVCRKPKVIPECVNQRFMLLLGAIQNETVVMENGIGRGDGELLNSSALIEGQNREHVLPQSTERRGQGDLLVHGRN